jgi:TPR repeat protein
MYANGRGVAQDYEEAVRWYRLAAKQGDALAQTQLGEAYAKGWGLREDDILSYM